MPTPITFLLFLVRSWLAGLSDIVKRPEGQEVTGSSAESLGVKRGSAIASPHPKSSNIPARRLGSCSCELEVACTNPRQRKVQGNHTDTYQACWLSSGLGVCHCSCFQPAVLLPTNRPKCLHLLLRQRLSGGSGYRKTWMH